VDKFNWCAYALNTPPKAVLIAGGGYKLQGTPPFVVNGSALGAGVKTFGAGTCITSLTDATDNPTSILPTAPSISRSGGNASQTVTQNSAITAITYTATNASGITLSSGSFPAGLSYGWSSNKYVISGSPTAAGTFTYTITTTNSQSCTNATATGKITVNSAITYTGCTTPSITLGAIGFTSSTTYSRNGLTISSPVTATYCNNRTYSTFDGGSSGSHKADCAQNYYSTSYGNWFSWCMVKQYASQLCPSPWHVPTKEDHCKLVNNSTTNCSNVGWSMHGVAGYVFAGFVEAGAPGYPNGGLYWSATDLNDEDAYNLGFHATATIPENHRYKKNGYDPTVHALAAGTYLIFTL
jgi:uncharacterized protein (TIGR02145 family)